MAAASTTVEALAADAKAKGVSVVVSLVDFGADGKVAKKIQGSY